ncbi:TPA: hypothetical protein L4556_002545 [Pseudomonas aeruginosa]|nr:hypothetical protein [Pseudomonas aeruginosa]
MSALLAKPLALVLAALLLVAAGAGLGVWLAAGHYRPQLDQAAQDLANCRAAAQRLQQEHAEGDPAQVAADIIDKELGL